MVKMLKDVKILLADDDEEVLAALNDVLRSEGYEVIMAKNGRAAIEYFHEGHIDIALLDRTRRRLAIDARRPGMERGRDDVRQANARLRRRGGRSSATST